MVRSSLLVKTLGNGVLTRAAIDDSKREVPLLKGEHKDLTDVPILLIPLKISLDARFKCHIICTICAIFIQNIPQFTR